MSNAERMIMVVFRVIGQILFLVAALMSKGLSTRESLFVLAYVMSLASWWILNGSAKRMEKQLCH